MLDHHIQRTILYTLAYTDGIRFSELKPDDVENKLFDYHLKKVVRAGYATKTSEGLYQLSAEGKRIWKSVLRKQTDLASQAYSILFMVVRRASDNAWLLYRRKAQPFIGKMGFMQAHPTPYATIAVTASKELKQKTGLEGDFTPLSSGYLRIFDEDIVESFTHFTLLFCDDARGELVQNDEFGEYEWIDLPNFANKDYLPTVQTLAAIYEQKLTGITEQTFTT